MKIKTTLNLDAELVRRIRVRAARLGKRDTEVYEEALRLGLSAIDSLRVLAGASDDNEMHRLVNDAVHEVRRDRQRVAKPRANTKV